MKKILFFAATAMLFAACSSDEVNAPEVTKDAPQAVAFDTYVPNATRAGATGVMTTTTLQTTGFGVFAQQSDNGDYLDTKGYNFMYNQLVSYSASAWTYTPLKYWPNETTKDSQTDPATSTATDKLSFFAYAPYVATVSGSEGIIALSANDATTDPLVTYAVSTTPANSVDLLWGVAPSGGLSYESVNPDVTINIAEGMPLKNLIKPAKDQKIKFLFKHALARLGMTVVAAVDQVSAGGTLQEGGVTKTKVFVESVSVSETTASKVLGTKGILNLNNTTAGTANWYISSGFSGFGATVDADNGLNAGITWTTDAATSWSVEGVTTSEKPVIANDKFFMVIPTHNDAELSVTITYYVCTYDANLSSAYATTKNVITKKVTIPTLTNNKAYNLKLILGLTSVKLDAEVADWQVDGSTEVNLPQNKE